MQKNLLLLSEIKNKVDNASNRCTGCNEQVNHLMKDLVFTHPLLGVLLCKVSFFLLLFINSCKMDFNHYSISRCLSLRLLIKRLIINFYKDLVTHFILINTNLHFKVA